MSIECPHCNAPQTELTHYDGGHSGIGHAEINMGWLTTNMKCVECKGVVTVTAKVDEVNPL